VNADTYKKPVLIKSLYSKYMNVKLMPAPYQWDLPQGQYKKMTLIPYSSITHCDAVVIYSDSS